MATVKTRQSHGDLAFSFDSLGTRHRFHAESKLCRQHRLQANACRRSPANDFSSLAMRDSPASFMDEARRGGVKRRACCVVILDKGKPVVTPGRKARGRRIETFVLTLARPPKGDASQRGAGNEFTRCDAGILSYYFFGLSGGKLSRLLGSATDGGRCSNQPPRAFWLSTTIRVRSVLTRTTARESEDAMKNLALKVQRFLESEDGPTAVEYAVMLALIVIVCLTAIRSIGTAANQTFEDVAAGLNNV